MLKLDASLAGPLDTYEEGVRVAAASYPRWWDHICTVEDVMRMQRWQIVRARIEAQVERKTYYSARNKFERFRGFLELISRFEFEFCRCVNYFLKDSNFWCVHVNVPWPVCAHAIPFRMLWLP